MQSGKQNIERPVHGGINLAEVNGIGLKTKDVLDFSANINPLGVCDEVKRAISELDASVYPDPDCAELRQAISQNNAVPIQNIIVGNGSTELIHLIARTCLSASEKAYILSPTFGEYEMACKLAGVSPHFINASEEQNFRWPVPDICRGLEDVRPALTFLCNPNNPTGVYLDADELQKIARSASPGLVVIDEAYQPFVDGPFDSKILIKNENVILLRSMTKDHALAGLRLGYAIAPLDLIDGLRTYQPFWSVNIAAQKAGIAALSDPGHLEKARKLIGEAKSYLYKALESLGLKALPSRADFILVKVGDARAVRFKLLQKGLCVRDCTSFGLPQYIRISVRSIPDCKRLTKGMEEVFND